MSYKKSSQASDKFEMVTQKLLSLMDKGVKPWVKPWFSTPYKNAVTGHIYRGINPLLCTIDSMINGWEHPLFLTFNQAQQQGWLIRKGAKATWLRWGGLVASTATDQETGEISKRFYSAAKWHQFFSIHCCDDSNSDKKIADITAKIQHNQNNLVPIVAAEDFIKKQQAKVSFGGDRACYCNTLDEIRMPQMADFTSAEAFYATYVHELIHWSGNKSRLNRDLSGQFGSKKYAFEELVAELGSAFCCNELNMSSEIENHASYLESWIQVCKGDNKAFFNAAALATKAAKYLMANAGINQAEEETHKEQ